MATVPRLTSVKSEVGPTVFQSSSSATPDAFGAGVNQAIAKVGAQGTAVANDLQDLQIKTRLEDNVRETKQKDVELAKRIQEIMWGEDGFYKKQGENAIGAYAGAQKQIEDARKEIGQTSTNKNIEEMFGNAADTRLTAERTGMDKHLFGQRKVASEKASTARTGASQKDFAIGWNDPLKQTDDVNRLAAESAARSDELGEGEAAAKERAQNDLGVALSGGVKAALVSKSAVGIAHAERMMIEHSENLDPTVRADLMGKIRAIKVETVAQTVSTEAFAKFPNDPAKARAWIEKVYSGDIETEGLKIYNQRLGSIRGDKQALEADIAARRKIKTDARPATARNAVNDALKVEGSRADKRAALLKNLGPGKDFEAAKLMLEQDFAAEDRDITKKRGDETDIETQRTRKLAREKAERPVKVRAAIKEARAEGGTEEEVRDRLREKLVGADLDKALDDFQTTINRERADVAEKERVENREIATDALALYTKVKKGNNTPASRRRAVEESGASAEVQNEAMRLVQRDTAAADKDGSRAQTMYTREYNNRKRADDLAKTDALKRIRKVIDDGGSPNDTAQGLTEEERSLMTRADLDNLAARQKRVETGKQYAETPLGPRYTQLHEQFMKEHLKFLDADLSEFKHELTQEEYLYWTGLQRSTKGSETAAMKQGYTTADAIAKRMMLDMGLKTTDTGDKAKRVSKILSVARGVVDANLRANKPTTDEQIRKALSTATLEGFQGGTGFNDFFGGGTNPLNTGAQRQDFVIQDADDQVEKISQATRIPSQYVGALIKDLNKSKTPITLRAIKAEYQATLKEARARRDAHNKYDLDF